MLALRLNLNCAGRHADQASDSSILGSGTLRLPTTAGFRQSKRRTLCVANDSIQGARCSLACALVVEQFLLCALA